MAKAADPGPKAVKNASSREMDIQQTLLEQENKDLQSRRLFRRQRRGTMSSDLGQQLESRDDDDGYRGRMKSRFFGRRPSFEEFVASETTAEQTMLKLNTRQTVDAYLRRLGNSHVETKNLILDRKGSCYFYHDKFLVLIQVPTKYDESYTISTVVQWRKPHKDEARQQRQQQYDSDAILSCIERDNVALKELPGQVTIRLKRKHQVNLCHTKQIAATYDEFENDLNDFVRVAENVKQRLVRFVEL